MTVAIYFGGPLDGQVRAVEGCPVAIIVAMAVPTILPGPDDPPLAGYVKLEYRRVAVSGDHALYLISNPAAVSSQ